MNFSRYDKSSMITARNDTAYAYDEQCQLISAGENSYRYDLSGNRLDDDNSRVDPITNRLTQRGNETYEYDTLGRLILKTSPATITEYTYNIEGYLGAYMQYDAHHRELLVSIIFIYDPLGRRLSKHYRSRSVEYHHRYLYAGDNIVAIYDNDTDELLATLLHDERIDTPLSISLYDKGSLSTWEIEQLDNDERYLYQQSLIHTYYYHRDHQNSILALTDKEGRVVESYSYDPYGNITHSTKNTETHNPYRYSGREYDTPDLYYYRARYYDPTLGRFITPDPIGFAGGDTNFYRYVGNDPVNFTDPSGLTQIGYPQTPAQDALSSQQGTQRFGGQTLADALRGSTNRQHTSSRPTDGVMVRHTQPEIQQVTHGYFYDHEGKFLGNNGTENVVYAADAKASLTEYTNPIKLALTHTEFQTASAIVKHEGITNDKKEYLWIAHASKNAADNSGTTIYAKLMSGYSSVPNGEKIPLPTTSNSTRSNYARAGVIHALLKEDPTNGASLWDGTDFLAWGLHSPNGTPQNKFEEYKTITIDVGIYETFLSNTLVAYPNHSVNYYGQPYNIPDGVFTDPSNWTVDKFIYDTNQNVPKSLTATGTAGRSIFWRKH